MTGQGGIADSPAVDHLPDTSKPGSFLTWRRAHAVAPGTPCANCGTRLQGPWCHACGQAATETHRHAHHLISEAFESFFHADGRLWRTAPRLVADPDGLTRDYLAGKRASQVPPMRMFLVALFVLFLAGTWMRGGAGVFDIPPIPPADEAELAKAHIDLDWLKYLGQSEAAWLKPRIGAAIAHPDQLSEAMSAKAHDFAFLMLPLSAAILALIFLFNRRFVLFDHFVFSMHSLAFQGFLISAVILTKMVSVQFGWLMLAAPVHLFFHMRGTYGTGVFGTLVRMAILFCASGIAFALLLAGLLLVGLQGLRA